MKKEKQSPGDVIHFPYEGELITFLSGDRESIMVNASEMAKPFGKLAKDWLRQKSTKDFLDALSSVRRIPLTELIKVIQGGNPKMQGTWMHEDVALEFARWLNPRFSIWCNDTIKMLLKRAYLPNGIELRMQQLERVGDSKEELRNKYVHFRLLGMSENAPIMRAIKDELNK